MQDSTLDVHVHTCKRMGYAYYEARDWIMHYATARVRITNI